MNHFEPKLIAPAHIDIEKSLIFIFHQDKIVINADEQVYPIPRFTSKIQNLLTNVHYLGVLDGVDCFCGYIENPDVLPELKAISLRRAYETLSHKFYHDLGDALFAIACRAIQIINWDKNHQFCSRCGSNIIIKLDERAKVCHQCNLHFYPKFSPSIIVAIEKNDEILLARSPHFYPGMYSVLAGFVEPGESAEDTITREVYEEVGLQVHNLRYYGSQSWPFPDSFMIGFVADYLSGEIVIDNHEIEDARWFNVNNLPPLPSPASIARKLIEQFIQKFSK